MQKKKLRIYIYLIMFHELPIACYTEEFFFFLQNKFTTLEHELYLYINFKFLTKDLEGKIKLLGKLDKIHFKKLMITIFSFNSTFFSLFLFFFNR